MANLLDDNAHTRTPENVGAPSLSSTRRKFLLTKRSIGRAGHLHGENRSLEDLRRDNIVAGLQNPRQHTSLLLRRGSVALEKVPMGAMISSTLMVDVSAPSLSH